MTRPSRDDAAINCSETFNILPVCVLELLKAQTIRYRQDFEKAISLIPSAKASYQHCPRNAEDSFKYAWCIVNTRCLYFNPTLTLAQSTKHNNDSLLIRQDITPSSNHHMVLCPLIDLFNHTSPSPSPFSFPSSSKTCTVTHTTLGFTVRAPQTPPLNEASQLFVSYGPHSNSFLLSEYGFLLSSTTDDTNTNAFDTLPLDPLILPILTQSQKDRLEMKGYLGAYTLFSAAANGGKAGVCWRTEVVARITRVVDGEWERFADGLVNEDEDGDVAREAEERIRGWVAEMERWARRSVEGLEGMIAGDDEDEQQQHPEIVRLFHDDMHDLDDSVNEARVADRAAIELRIARRRYALVLQRWRQILQICRSFLLLQKQQRDET